MSYHVRIYLTSIEKISYTTSLLQSVVSMLCSSQKYVHVNSCVLLPWHLAELHPLRNSIIIASSSDGCVALLVVVVVVVVVVVALVVVVVAV